MLCARFYVIACVSLLLLCCCRLGSPASSTTTTTSAIVADQQASTASHSITTITCKSEDDDDIHSIIDQETCPRIASERPSYPHKQKQKKLEVVTFAAREEVRSPALSLPPSSLTSTTPSTTGSKASLYEFFTAAETIDLQFADRAQVQPIPHPSPALVETFHRLNAQRRLEAGLAPIPPPSTGSNDEADTIATRIVGLVNPPMHCLGLVLHSVTHVGIQTFAKDGQYPEVHLTLMETNFEATGPKFLVSLFYKIMLAHEDDDNGDINDSEGKQKAVETIGFTRIWAEAADEDGNEIVFVDQARLEAKIYVPPLLIKLFPLSKKRMEQAGSATILKTIRKDMVPAMDRLVGAYRIWIEEHDNMHVKR